MKTNDQDLRKAFRDRIESRPEICAQGCLRAEDIWALFAGKQSTNRKARMVDHITNCPSCLREFEAFLEVSRAEGELTQQVLSRFQDQPRRALFPLLWRYVTALLILITVLGVAILATKWQIPERRMAERGRLSGQLRLLAPGLETRIRLPLVFRWEGIPNGESYVVEIFDDSLLPFWKSPQLTDTNYELPLSVKEKMAKGKRYFWMLTAFSRTGLKTESSLEEFKLIN